MKFETRRISIEEQIECVGKFIEQQKSMLRVFDKGEDEDIRTEFESDLLNLVAVRISLKRLVDEGGVTSVSAPADREKFDEWYGNAHTPKILEQLDPDFVKPFYVEAI